jgi:PKD repeat protein
MTTICCLPLFSQAQDYNAVIQSFLEENSSIQGWEKQDITNWSITDQHVSRTSKVTHVYIRQTLQNIPVSNGVANFAIKNGKVMHMGNRLIDNLSRKATYSTPAINPLEAIQKAAEQLELDVPNNLKIKESLSSTHFVYEKGQLSKEEIPVQLFYFATEDDKVHLVWDLSIYTLDAQNWWSVKVDAQTGKILNKNNWVHHCSFGTTQNATPCAHNSHLTKTSTFQSPNTLMQPDQYTVFKLPIESPNHGAQTMVVNPADVLASPFGWHDTNGATGAEFTITRGNNVYAYDDVADANQPGSSPDGTTALEFNFPYSASSSNTSNLPAAITNLFYMNNMMHDIWYYYGFDEASGNFQSNNYNRGGNAGDFVLAEAQDGGGSNNANFATPPDGNNPRMQMYLWGSALIQGDFTVNSPAGVAGTYTAVAATFGPGWPANPVTGDLAVVIDGTAPTVDGCEPLVNGAAINGKIAVLDRGSCAFVDKVQNAQNAGAIAVVVVNDQAGVSFAMGGNGPNITIPAIMISQADGNTLKAAINAGTVNATFSPSLAVSRDGDFDNGIIAHEYGHGISTRLSGGANTSGCLQSAEQMGEGWSDWFGLMLTLEATDRATDVRGVGTYADGQATTGRGIRPAAYSRARTVNNFTYGSSNNTAQITEPHGIGFIYCTALWDMTWDLIDFYGGVPDTNYYTGTGGNNIAMNLVIESLKLQPCNPGMLDGRDAILAADRLLYNGIHQCLIWNAFADRGFGFSADQGSVNSRTDQIEAFDLPPSCQTPTQVPSSAFTPSSLTSCQTTINFTDSSFNVPQAWFWSFGDGNTDTIQNPSHTYTNTGTYTVELIVSNPFGNDTSSQVINISLPPAPVANDVEVCFGSSARIIATGSTGQTEWLDVNNNPVATGDTLFRIFVGTPQTYYAQNVVASPSQKVPPIDNNIGTGGIHSSAFHGALNFTAQKGFIIKSAWVNAQGTGPRTFYLGAGSNNNGQLPATIVDQVTVNLVNGIQRVTLNMEVPAAGDYNIGGSNVDLYRNNAGANYPYTLPGYMSITSSSATTNAAAFYYYLYDMEVQDAPCVSALDTATVTPLTSDFNYTQASNTFAFSDQSTGATNWFWDFGDGNTSTLQNPTHTYATNGNYTVTLQINNNLCSTSQTVSFITNINSLENNKPTVTLLPNPAISEAVIQLSRVTTDEDLTIQVTDLQGRVLHQGILIQNTKDYRLDLSTFAPAVYVVTIQGKAFTETRKLIVRD